jgi:hypothetical protein
MRRLGDSVLHNKRHNMAGTPRRRVRQDDGYAKKAGARSNGVSGVMASPTFWRPRRFGVPGVLVVTLISFSIAPRAHAATHPATPSTFASVWSGAAGGDVIVLAAGSYGAFNGGSKASPVTIQPASGAIASMSLNFNSANNIKIDGLTITGASVSTSRNLTITNCKFTGQMVLRADVANANILVDHSTFDGISVTPNDYEGRLQIIGSAAPAGIIISNCHFSGGESDGIQIGADGVQIGPGNEFANILQGNSTLHIDPLQLYGARNTLITGNYFHDNSTSIMAPDGGTNEQIINNVFAGTNYPSITAGSWNGALISHNVILDAVRVYSGNSNVASKNVIVRDYVAPNLAISAGQASVEDYNLVPSGGTGAHDVRASPQYVGGTRPTSYVGFKLAAGTPGTGKASDGTDIGITLTAVLPSSACDLNGDSATNVSDVQQCVNQAIGTVACSTGDINKDSVCNVIDVQRTVNAALGGQCVSN